MSRVCVWLCPRNTTVCCAGHVLSSELLRRKVARFFTADYIWRDRSKMERFAEWSFFHFAV